MSTNGIEIRIDALAFGGDGVGRLPGGKAVFVASAAPGDLVRVRVVEEKARVAFAVIDELVEPAPERVLPRCPLADRCGGCTWQHLPVDVQRSWKARLVARELERRGLGHDGVLAAVQGGAAFGHRTRARLHRRGVAFGTLPRRSHAVLPLQVCPVLAPPLERFALDLAALLGGLPPFDADVELYVDADGRRGLAVDDGLRAPDGVWERLAVALEVVALRVKGGPCATAPGQASSLIEASGAKPLAFEPGVFVQTSREGNALLVAAALEAAGEGATFAEVYAGVGNFTVHLAERFRRGSASEVNAASVRWLRRNLGGAAHVTAHAEPDAASARRLGAQPPVDLLLADPPHVGMRPLEPLFDAAPPRRVVLVSCHPMAALRDLERLVGRGYRLRRLVPIDLFPQTDHLELVATLDRDE
jgi:23S rRNA (uracil1939-C5)-methyltransferase